MIKINKITVCKWLVKRTLSLLMATLLAMGLYVNAFAADDYSSWKQSDSRWGGLGLGNLCTMSNSGCLLTSIAIQMAASGAEGDSFTPATLRDRVENGGFVSHASSIEDDGNLDYAAAFSQENSPNFYFAGTKDYTYSPFVEIRDSIASLQNEGYYVVVAVNYYGHYVAAADATGSDVPIYDPAGSGKTMLSQYDGGIMQAIYFKANSIHHEKLPEGVTATNLQLVVTKSNGAVIYTGPAKVNSVVRRLDPGTLVKTIGFTVNQYDHVWYYLEDGTYIFSDNVKIDAYLPTTSISGVVAPAGTLPQGKIFVLKGYISGKRLIKVTVNVIGTNGEKALSASDKASGSYSLQGSTIDVAMTINTLPCGHYRYEIVATEDLDTGKQCVTFDTVLYTSEFSIG